MTPLVVALTRFPSIRGRRAFGLGFVTGTVYFAGTLYWLVETMTTFGGLSLVLALVAAAFLVGYLSLFPATFAWTVARLHARLGSRALFLAPSAWVSSELGRQYVWDGFPWALLGYSQITVLPVAQVASLTGVYGLSFVLAGAGTAAAFAISDRSRRRWIATGSVAVALALTVVWGAARLKSSALLTQGDPIRVGVVQGNIEQEEKWNPANREAISSRYITMTRQALAGGARFVMWPESATPLPFEQDILGGSAIRRLAMESGATLLVGSDQVEPIKTALPDDKVKSRFYNAAFLVKPDGAVGAVYRKMHLVPFGEYVPLQSLLFFAGPIVGALADFSSFTPGEVPVLLPVGAHRASTAICYEVIYPNLIRQAVRDGSELLTTITNDAWYGRSSAAYQHWDQASMRAIEQGRYLARAANTGISGFVDPYGRVMSKSALFEPAVLVEDVRFLTDRTLYSRVGDLVAWLSLALTAAGLLATARFR